MGHNIIINKFHNCEWKLVAYIHWPLKIRFIGWQIIQENEREESFIILADSIIKIIIKILINKIIP